jgi:hypothetical protein
MADLGLSSRKRSFIRNHRLDHGIIRIDVSKEHRAATSAIDAHAFQASRDRDNLRGTVDTTFRCEPHHAHRIHRSTIVNTALVPSSTRGLMAGSSCG